MHNKISHMFFSLYSIHRLHIKYVVSVLSFSVGKNLHFAFHGSLGYLWSLTNEGGLGS